jgi:hypothetical protein
MRRIAVAAFTLGSLACVHRRESDVGRNVGGDCAPTARTPTSVVDSIAMRKLVGEFDLTTVITVPGYQEPVRRGRLRLALNDTTNRFYYNTMRGLVRQGNRLLAGTYVSPPSTWDTVTTEGSTLVVGCDFRMCFDGSPDYLTVEQVDDRGFSGSWANAQSGNTRAFDKTGRMLPDPAGVFCARRVGA